MDNIQKVYLKYKKINQLTWHTFSFGALASVYILVHYIPRKSFGLSISGNNLLFELA